MDAMVTGRMPLDKKERGNRLLKELGANASQAINALYDYVIEHHALPFSAPSESPEERLRDAVRRVDSIPKVTLDERFAAMDAKSARAERLSRELELGGRP